VEPMDLTASPPRRGIPWKRAAMWALVIGGGVGALVAAKPVYRESKAWRARRLGLQVEALISEGRLDGAVEKARAAYQLKPDEPASMRAAARVEGAYRRHQSALGFWKKLAESGAMELLDRKRMAEDLLRAGLPGAAEKELRELLKSGSGDAQLERLAAQVSYNLGDRAEALRHAERAVSLESENPEGRLLLGLLLWDAPDPASQNRGVDLVCGVAADKGRVGLDALLALSRREGLKMKPAEKLADLAMSHPLASSAQRLLALDIRLKACPEKMDELKEAALKNARAGSPEDRRALGVWFNNRREYERALEAVPISEAAQRKDLLLVHLDALAALKRWDEVAAVLAGKDAPLDEVYRELFLARSAMERGENGVADVHWRRAHLAAAVSTDQAWYVAGYAERLGRSDQAEVAYRNLTSNATTARPAYESLLRIAERRDDAATVAALLRGMRERWPADLAVENDAAFFNLLLGEFVDGATESARKLVATDPSSLPHRTTLALGLLKSGDPGAALKVYAALNVPWNQVPASQRCVYCAVLAANGRLEEARALLRGIDTARLRRVERRLLENHGLGG
jgi:hypothetical protein